MWKHTLLLVCLSGCCLAGPLHGVKRNVPIVLHEDDAELERPAPEPLAPEYPEMPSTLTLPSNATSIRADITDSFSCDDKVYGYYADVENDCQIFHVCLPVTYADGKENTFRWSFICPEETVFSQESFTCMRREDIAFSCEDSVNYYELNRNFGNTEEQHVNSNNAQANEEQAETQAAEPAEPAEQEVEQAVAPQAAAPAPQPAKPVKPVKMQKPNRRKPQPKPQQNQAIYPTNKLPSIMPLRKMPNVGPNVPVSVPAEVVSVQAAEKDEVKVVPPRYKKRPAVSYNSEKEIVEVPAQPFKVELVHTVSNPESYKRRRPTFAHKNNVVTKVSEDVPVAVETAPEAVEAAEPIVPAVKFESNLGASPVQAQEETVAVEEPVAQVAVELPVAEAETPIISDAEPQASEIGEVAVEPEQTLKTIAVQPLVPDAEATQAEEAFVAPIELAQPVVEAEPEYVAPIAEETIKIEEPIAEEVSKSEEAPAEEKIKVEEPFVAELEVPAEVEPENEALNKEPVAETIEDKPTVTGDALQNAATEEKIEEVPTEQQINVKILTQAEEQAPLIENTEDQLAGASEPVALETEPEVIAPVENAEESLPALPSLEELEEQKPANAVEVMPASPEMEQQDPIVQQAFEGSDAHLQTVGGFKPVDPEMAAEAEALISDFINTLKSAHPNEKPILPESVEEEVPAASAESEDTKIDIITPQQTEEKIVEAEAQPEEVPAAAEDKTNSLKTVASEEPLVETENVPVVAGNEPVEEEEVKVSPLLKFPISNSFPANMYQIPVTVIQTPYEEVQNAETEVQEPQEQINAEEVKAEALEAPVEEAAPAVAETQEQLKFLPEKTEAEIIPVEETEQEVQPAIVDFVETKPETVQATVADAVEVAPEAVLPALPEVMETVPETESEVAQPAAPVAFRPISIDDIVELVKERLDQAPADEKGAPMELIVDSGNADKPVELKFSLEKGSAPQEVSAEQTPAEDIIFPIYHRVSEPEVSAVQVPEDITAEEPSAFVTELKKLPVEAEAVQDVVEPIVQTVDQAVQTNADELEANVAVKSATNTETEQAAEVVAVPVANAQETESEAAVVSADEPVQTETVEAESAKANRALRSRSLTKAKLDPRKRRFLFRSDAS
ncbi:titin [Bactrocera dorsalis]|uniref:Titin n=1 Tax=Bactrocera dorsalis TaxID=27457 RepID=A0A6I9VN79_BACDO|nr:titin [Bactrocera dorsalis]